jgi:hypothetical protein
MDKLLFQMHVMWYESEMMMETLDSIHSASLHSQLPIEFRFCLNSQTYIEQPMHGESVDMFERFTNHSLLQKASITYKTNDDAFYNIGDWRREVYSNQYKYTIWGESDCLLPEDFFYILSMVQIDSPHILTFASRKMWDSTWDCVEHTYVEQFKRLSGNPYTAPKPYNSDDVITQSELNTFNEQYDDIILRQLDTCKIDGSLLCLSSGVPTPFIAPDMHFVREDTCAEQVFIKYNIPQYVVKNRMKGHNYGHPKKRTNTSATRTDAVYNEYSQKSMAAMNTFLRKIYEL